MTAITVIKCNNGGLKITRKIIIASGKGGVGKTTITANLGVALASYGLDVTLLDSDVTMANLELILGMEGRSVTLNDVLSGDADISEAIYEGPRGVKVIPAGLSLETLKKVEIGRLENTLEFLAEQTDVILIDAPAGLGKDALAAISSAQEMILVTTPEIPALSDALKTKLVASKLGVNVLGVVVNRDKNDRTFLATKEIEIILRIPVLAKIPDDPEVSRSAAFAEPFVLKNPNSIAYTPIMQLGANIMGIDYTPFVPDYKGIVSKLIDGMLGKKETI